MLLKTAQRSLNEERSEPPGTAAGQIVWVMDAEGGMTDDQSNTSWRTFTGQTREEARGRGWLNALHPEDCARVAAIFAQAIKTRSIYNAEYRLRRHDGAYRVICGRGVPVLDRDGDVSGWLGSSLDITERRQTEEALRERRQELNEAQRLARMGSWVWEPEPDIATWSEELYRIFGCDPALPAPNYREQQQFFTSESWERLGASVEKALQTGMPYELDLELIRADGQRAWLTARGEVQRDASGRIVKLRGTAHDITERKQAEEELQWKTAFLEAQVHGSIDGILVVDTQGKNILINQRMADLWELPPFIANDRSDQKQLQFVIMNRLKHPEQFIKKVNHLYSHPDEISRDEIELKNGTVLDRYSAPVIDKNGKYYGRIWTFRDITGHKRTEEALKKAHNTLEQRVEERTTELKIANEQLQQTNRLLHILSECNQQVVHAGVESELLREICRLIVGPGGYPSVWIGFAEDNPEKTVRPVAQQGFAEGYLEGLTITWADTELGWGPTGSAIRSGKPCIVQDVHTDAGFAPWREDAVKLGFSSMVGLPLRTNGRVFGSLTIYARVPNAFTFKETSVLQELTDDLAYGIMSLRARGERERAEKDLRRIADLQSAILNNTLYTVISTDEKGIITSINPAAERALGYTAAECVGKLMPLFIDPREIAERAGIFSAELGYTIEPGFEVLVARARRDLPNEYEWTHERKDGSRFIALISVTALRDSQRNIMGFLGVGNDITRRKQAEDALRESRQELNEAQRIARIGSWVWEPERDLVTLSEELYHMFGLDPAQPPSGYKELQRFYTPRSWERLTGAMEQALQRGTPYELDLEMICMDGQRLWITSRGEVQRDASGRIVKLRGAAQDITERKRARDEIYRLNIELEKRVAERTAELAAANRELETFNYSVSHDLRTPLRTVDGFTRLLKEEYSNQFDPQAHEYLDLICSAVERMDQLIRGLLNLSQITRGQIRSRSVNLSAMASTFAAELHDSGPQRAVEFVIAPELTAEGDPELLRSVLQNLLGNAWKYTSKHPQARIEFGTEQAGGETVFYVRDDGAGFHPDAAGKLFNAFQRLHNADEFPGTGIGLATVQRIIQRHGGRIWAEGAEEKGATFYFTIPTHN